MYQMMPFHVEGVVVMNQQWTDTRLQFPISCSFPFSVFQLWSQDFPQQQTTCSIESDLKNSHRSMLVQHRKALTLQVDNMTDVFHSVDHASAGRRALRRQCLLWVFYLKQRCRSGNTFFRACSGVAKSWQRCTVGGALLAREGVGDVAPGTLKSHCCCSHLAFITTWNIKMTFFCAPDTFWMNSHGQWRPSSPLHCVSYGSVTIKASACFSGCSWCEAATEAGKFLSFTRTSTCSALNRLNPLRLISVT